MTGITTLRRGSGPGQIALQSDSLPPLPKCRTYKWATGFSGSLIYRLLHTSCMSTNSLRHTNTGTLSTTRAHGYSHSHWVPGDIPMRCWAQHLINRLLFHNNHSRSDEIRHLGGQIKHLGGQIKHRSRSMLIFGNFHQNIPNTRPGCHRCLSGS